MQNKEKIINNYKLPIIKELNIKKKHIKNLNKINQDIKKTEKKIKSLVIDSRNFLLSANKLNLIKSITYRIIPIFFKKDMEDRPTYGSIFFHTPNLHWIEEVNHKEIEILDWNIISKYLDEKKASQEEILLHMQVHIFMQYFKVKVEPLVLKLRRDIILQRELKKIVNTENIMASLNNYNKKLQKIENSSKK